MSSIALTPESPSATPPKAVEVFDDSAIMDMIESEKNPVSDATEKAEALKAESTIKDDKTVSEPKPEPAKEPAKDSPPAKEDVWFDKDRGLKTIDDAVKNQDKRFGGIAQKVGDIESKIDKALEKLNSLPSSTAAAKEAKISPTTGEEVSLEQAKEEWKQVFLEDEAKGLDLWMEKFGTDKVMKAMQPVIDKVKADAKSEAKAEIEQGLTFRAFIENNPDLQNADKKPDMDKLNAISKVFDDMPVLNKRKDALVVAKEIALTAGDDTESKYQNWLANKNNKGDEPKAVVPVAPALPSAGGIKPSGSAPEKSDAFGKWAEGIGL